MKTIVTPEPAPTLGDLFGGKNRVGTLLRPDVTLTCTGRCAYMLGLRMLRLSGTAKVLLPALCCTALVSATRAAGAVPIFYDIKDDLRPDLDGLEKRATEAEALVVIHYLGFPQPLEEILEFCKRTGIRLIEDCAHSLYSRVDGKLLGSFGVFSFFSASKILPVPNGGAAVWNNGLCSPPFSLPRSRTFELLSASKCLLRCAENLLRLSPRAWLLSSDNLRRAIAGKDATARPASFASARLSEKALLNADPDAIVTRRRENYTFLLSETRGLLDGSLPGPLADGVSPMGFPLLVRDRRSFMRRMLREKIVVRPLWSELPDGVDARSHPTAARVGRHLVYVPVHQALRRAQVERIGAALKKSLREDACEKIFDS